MKNRAEFFANELKKRLQFKTLSEMPVIDFCNELNTSRQNFYYYFKSMEECLIYLLLSENPMNTNIDRPQDSVKQCVKFLSENTGLVKNICKQASTRELFINFYYEYFKNAVKKYVNYCIKIDFKLTETEKDILVKSITYQYLLFIFEFIRNPEETKLLKTAKILEFLTRGNIEELAKRLHQYSSIASLDDDE